MHLRDLHPTWVPRGSNRSELIFDCPLCKAPKFVFIQVHNKSPVTGIWQWDNMMSIDDPVRPWDQPGGLTIIPSIADPWHGRKKCSAHFSIIKSQVIMA